MNKIFTVGPLKMEFLSRNPDVVQIHQAFTEANVRKAMTDIGGTNPSLKSRPIKSKKMNTFASV